MSILGIDDPAIREVLEDNYVLLLTSNSVEKRAVNRQIVSRRSVRLPFETNGCYLGRINERFVIHLSGDSGGSKEKSLGRLASRYFQRETLPRPTLAVAVGFCWGNPTAVSPGDVVVATSVSSINHVREGSGGAVRREARFTSKLEIDDDILSHLAAPTGQLPPAKVGILASAETYLGATNAREEILRQFPAISGGEMEAYHFVPDLDVPWIILKAVADEGDDFVNRASQYSAADSAAVYVGLLVELLDQNELLTPPKVDITSKRLATWLSGGAVRVSISDFEGDALNDHLNNIVGVTLRDRLSSFSSNVEYGDPFPRTMAGALLELMQNAFRHGRANWFEIEILDRAIICRDDGKAFDPQTLAGTNGGALAWRRLRTRYLDDHNMSFSVTSTSETENRYEFSLSKADLILRKAQENCVATVKRGSIGAVYGRQPVFEYPESCEVIYFDAAPVLMDSRLIEIGHAIREVANGGRFVLVRCENDDQKRDLEDQIEGVPEDKVRIIVRGD